HAVCQFLAVTPDAAVMLADRLDIAPALQLGAVLHYEIEDVEHMLATIRKAADAQAREAQSN
ncbi:MAG: hypothetical protein WCL32_23650, partial [Planctomycetota bacterium]